VGPFIAAGWVHSASVGATADDGKGKNGLYTESLVQQIKTPGMKIEDVFKRVRTEVRNKSGGSQVPEERSSLEGDFYFVRGSMVVEEPPRPPAVREPVTKAESDSDAEAILRQKEALEREKQVLERQKALDVEREQLAAERRKIETERQQMAMGPRPTVTGPRETGRDGRFISYDDRTALDTSTNLMWASMDNGYGIDWRAAKNYCETYRGGGYKDWRMPTSNELESLYEPSEHYIVTPEKISKHTVHLTKLIQLSCGFVWSLVASESGDNMFDFARGERKRIIGNMLDFTRALPVRSVK
jgi:hypothetical protein